MFSTRVTNSSLGNKNSIWPKYKRTVLDNPLLVLIAWLLFAAALFWHIPNFTIDATSDALLLEDDDELAFYRENVAKIANDNFLVLTFTPSRDLFTTETLKTVGKIEERFAAFPEIEKVVSILNVPLFNYKQTILEKLTNKEFPYLGDDDVDVRLAKEAFVTNPLYRELLVDKDGKTAAFLLFIKVPEKYTTLQEERESLRRLRRDQALDADQELRLALISEEFAKIKKVQTENERELVRKTRKVMADYQGNASLYLGGSPMIVNDIISFVENDLAVFGISSLLLMTIILALIFRQLRWVVLPVVCCLLVTLLVIGILGLFNWPGTIVSTNFAELLFVVTLSMVIHMVIRYQEMFAENQQARQKSLVSEVASFMFKPCLYTSATTMAAFASLLLSGIRPIIDFGWFMIIGLLLGLAVAFTFFPCVLLLLKKKKPAKEIDLTTRLTRAMANFSNNNSKLILFVATAIFAINIAGFSKLEVENSFIDYFKSGSQIRDGMLKIDRELGGTIPLDIIITSGEVGEEEKTDSDEGGGFGFDDLFADYGSDFDDADPGMYWLNQNNIERIEKIHKYLEELPQTGKVLSLATLIASVEQQQGRKLDPLGLALLLKALPPEISDVLVDPYLFNDKKSIRFSARVIDSDKQLNRKELLAEISEQVSAMVKDGESYRVTGLLVMYNNMLQSLYGSQIMTLGGVLVALLLMFVALFRSFALAIIALLPTTIAATFVLGAMGWFGIPLDMMTITIAAICMGIGVDSAIHYVVRFEREFSRTKDCQIAIRKCHDSVGKAVYYTSFIIIAGFSLLSFSNFLPTIYFGLLTGLAMLASFFASLIILPALLIVLRPPKAANA